MTWKLTKMSIPDWEKRFETKCDAMDELRTHICGLCMKDINGFDHELLGTPCGCEYDIEEEDMHP